ncbi:hypothetical protein MTO96_041023 [Rhipicephalus appendiculatus]
MLPVTCFWDPLTRSAHSVAVAGGTWILTAGPLDREKLLDRERLVDRVRLLFRERPLELLDLDLLAGGMMTTCLSGHCGRSDAEYRSANSSCGRVSSEESGVDSDSGVVVGVPSPLSGALTPMTLSGGR